MKNILSFLRKQSDRLYLTKQDPRTIDSINYRNISNIHTFSGIVFIVDAVSLILFTVTNRGASGFWKTFTNVAFYVISCLIVAGLSERILRKYKAKGTISNIKANTLITLFYMLMSIWSIVVDVAHYRAGDQMLTFYIVQFCFICFIVMKPKIGVIVISLSFLALFITLYYIDGAVGIQPQNYVIFALIAVFGNVIQNMLLQESEKYKADILELNQELKQEATIDDLTNLKNRTALRNDFDKHIGSNVYIIMADVDQFKHYNDVYGHAIGDEVLRLVAAVTGEIFCDGDVYRYGGDELLIILTECADEVFSALLSKWDEAIRAITIPEVTQTISVSCGYEHCLLENVDDLRNAIKIADSKLYIAKKARRLSAVEG